MAPLEGNEAMLCEPLLREADKPMTMRARADVAAAFRIPGLWAALCCVTMGVLHPLATESAKSARLTVCTLLDSDDVQCTVAGTETGVDHRQRVMPFFAVSLTTAAQVLSVAVAFTATIVDSLVKSNGVKRPREVVTAAALDLLDKEALLRLWPVGLVYGLGDFLQAVACNLASAHVVLIIGQWKLLLVALLSRLLLKKRSAVKSCRLLVISFAAAACALISANDTATEQARRSELLGSLIAFGKAGLSAAGAVLSERAYKDNSDGFFAASFRVQATMLATSCIVLPLAGGLEFFADPEAFFAKGPHELCVQPNRCDPGLGGACSCVDRAGWDSGTVVAAIAFVVNGVVTGLILKHLSAVAKSVCGVVSMAALYISCVCLRYRHLCLEQACIIVVIVVSTYEFATEGRARRSQRCRCRAETSGGMINFAYAEDLPLLVPKTVSARPTLPAAASPHATRA